MERICIIERAFKNNHTTGAPPTTLCQLEALVKVQIVRVALQPQPVSDVRFEAVNVDGGHLRKDGTAERCGKGQEEAAEQDLCGSVDPGVLGQSAFLLQHVHKHGDQDHAG